jgi:hypothetical protein
VFEAEEYVKQPEPSPAQVAPPVPAMVPMQVVADSPKELIEEAAAKNG